MDEETPNLMHLSLFKLKTLNRIPGIPVSEMGHVDTYEFVRAAFYGFAPLRVDHMKRTIVDMIYSLKEVPTFDVRDYESWMISQNTILDYFCASLLYATNDNTPTKKLDIYAYEDDLIIIPESVDRIIASGEIPIVRVSCSYMMEMSKACQFLESIQVPGGSAIDVIDYVNIKSYVRMNDETKNIPEIVRLDLGKECSKDESCK